MAARWFTALFALSLAASVTSVACVAPTGEDDAEDLGAFSSQKTAGYTLGFHEGIRDTVQTYFSIDTQKDSYTTKGKLTVHAYVERATEDEGADIGNSDVFRMDFEVTLDEYVRLFERNEAFRIAPRAGKFYVESAEASGPVGKRKIVFRWDNSDDDNDRKGELSIDQGPNGSITRARLKRWSKTFLVPFWHSIFEARVDRPAAQEPGLLLTDFGKRLGRVRSADGVKRAIDDPTANTFERVVGR